MKFHRPFFLYTLLISSFLATCPHAFLYAENAEYAVRNVVDGDTIELTNGRRVRYIGIDTPETMRHRGGAWVFAPESYAIEAKEYNTRAVSGEKVRLEFDEVREDRYGRWLAYVYDGKGNMINEELIRRGLAVLYSFPPNVRYFDRLSEAEEDARRNGRGLWGSVTAVSKDKTSASTGGISVVKGKIALARTYAGNIFLDVRAGGAKLMTAVIFKSNVSLFSGKGIDPETFYNGKNVEITGKVEHKNGPRMVIDNPFRIKVAK